MMTLGEFLEFFDFDYEKDEEGYSLIDCQGAYLGDIGSEIFETPAEVVARFQGSIYEPDYIGCYFEEELGVDVSDMSYKVMIEEGKKKGADQIYLDICAALDDPDSVVDDREER